jgi:hypothetical protein
VDGDAAALWLAESGSVVQEKMVSDDSRGGPQSTTLERWARGNVITGNGADGPRPLAVRALPFASDSGDSDCLLVGFGCELLLRRFFGDRQHGNRPGAQVALSLDRRCRDHAYVDLVSQLKMRLHVWLERRLKHGTGQRAGAGTEGARSRFDALDQGRLAGDMDIQLWHMLACLI